MTLALPRPGPLRAHELALDEANAAIARSVRARRTSLGVSLAALASASGVDLAALHGLEVHQQGCSAADLWRIAQALGASLSDICQPSRPELGRDLCRTFGSAKGSMAPAPAARH